MLTAYTVAAPSRSHARGGHRSDPGVDPGVGPGGTGSVLSRTQVLAGDGAG
jgi:hypothetical protein